MRPENGGTCQSGALAGTTSSWARSRSDGPGSPLSSLTTKLSRPLGSPAISPSMPRARNQSRMNSATWVSLPGGLLVSIWMSALSSSLVSRSTSATTTGSMPAMSSTRAPQYSS